MRFVVFGCALSAACSFAGAPSGELGERDAALSPEADAAADSAPDADQSPRCAPLPSGAIAWWDGEEIGVDILGNFSQATTFNTPSITVGLVGNALDLGENDDIIINPAPQATAFTVEAWVRRQKNDLDYMVIYGLQNESSLTLNDHRLVYFEPGGDIVTSAAEIALDVYQHVAATFDGTTIRLYIDGAADGVATDDAALPQPGRIGGVNLGDGNDFVGIVDELTVYDRALSTEEIAAIAMARELGKCRPDQAASSTTRP